MPPCSGATARPGGPTGRGRLPRSLREVARAYAAVATADDVYNVVTRNISPPRSRALSVDALSILGSEGDGMHGRAQAEKGSVGWRRSRSPLRLAVSAELGPCCDWLGHRECPRRRILARRSVPPSPQVDAGGPAAAFRCESPVSLTRRLSPRTDAQARRPRSDRCEEPRPLPRPGGTPVARTSGPRSRTPACPVFPPSYLPIVTGRTSNSDWPGGGTAGCTACPNTEGQGRVAQQPGGRDGAARDSRFADLAEQRRRVHGRRYLADDSADLSRTWRTERGASGASQVRYQVFCGGASWNRTSDLILIRDAL